MIKHAGSSLITLTAELFSELLKPVPDIPESWLEAFITLIFKSGDPRQAGNYRPITLLPILYKLFTRILRNRMQQTLESSQPVEQAGFRSGFNCDDHLLTM
eukprot:9190959-Karenia_brevis.AAC.1